MITATFRSISISLCFLFLLCGKPAFSQSSKQALQDTLVERERRKRQRDVPDLYRLIFKKKTAAKHDHEKGKKVNVAIVPAGGYSLITRLAFVVAANGAFFLKKDKITKQSVVNTSIAYTQNNQIIFPVLSNIWTKTNNYNLVGEWRYYRYPANTYGLGGHTSENITNHLVYSNIILHEAVLKHIGHSFFYAGLAYNLNYHWDISESGNSNGEVSDFQKYGFNKSSTSSGISVNATFDNRYNTINPSQASYANISFCPNTTLLGSNNNYNSLLIDLRKYVKPGSSDNVLAFWSYNWFTFNGNAPYLDLPSTGWDAYSNMGRGYIQGRFAGKNLVYAEVEYRFAVLRNGLLGGVLFTNAQSVTDWPSNKFTTVHPAVGTGIRIKLNKYSNTNMSVDYGFGLNGSRGIFINLGEVF